MKKLLLFVFSGMILSACSNSGNKTASGDQVKQNEIVITNDMENAIGVIPSWHNEKTVMAVKNVPAHSGEYAMVTNDTIEYSYTYRELIKNINGENPKTVTYSGWVYTTVANPNFAIICSVNENNQQYDWKAFPLDKELTEPGKWVEFSASFSFTDKQLKPEHEIGLYAWNQSKKPIYMDDLKIIFSY